MRRFIIAVLAAVVLASSTAVAQDQLLKPSPAKVETETQGVFIPDDYFVAGKNGFLFSVNELFQERYAGRPENTYNARLKSSKLTRNASFSEIRKELGESVDIHLAWLWTLIVRQSDGQAGFLDVTSRGNLAFGIDTTGHIRPILVVWWPERKGWAVIAMNEDITRTVREGTTIISR